MASPRHEGSPEPPPTLDVHRLGSSDTADSDSVVMVKLTDEIYTALMNAQRKKAPLRIKIDEKGGAWDLGDAGVFTFQTQSMPGETDTLRIDRKANSYCTVGSFRCKYQIQATDKSFAETREKAQKLAEEEKNKGVKDASKHRKGAVGAASRVGSATSSRHASPLLTKHSDSHSKISPNKSVISSTGNNGGSSMMTNGRPSANNNGSSSGRVSSHPLAAELRKKKLRTRIVHLIVTGRFSNTEEVWRQLRKDGLNEEQESCRKIDDIVKDVSERNEHGKLALKHTVHSEVDSRWPWFTQDEKASVRRSMQSSQQPLSSSSIFAPMRRSGMERMQAPSGGSGHSSQTVSPEAIPTPPTSRPSSGGSVSIAPSKKTSPPLVAPIRQSPLITPNRTPVSEDVVPMSSGSKRKAHVPCLPRSNNLSSSEKRPRSESASPPEDPTNNPPNHKEKLLAARAGGSTTSSRLSSPCSLSSPSQPSCDWEKLFPEIKTVHEAEKYFSLFHSDYPAYMDCYKQLNDVAKEFRDLENQLKCAGRVQRESVKIERSIQERFAHFEKDDDFLKVRQRHADLRSKLSVLKLRISEWERLQEVA